MITKENYIIAYFIDNERKNIEVLLKGDGKVNSYILEYDTKYPECEELLKICNLDQLHENTYKRLQEQKKEFEETVIRIAGKKGMVFDENKLDTKFYPTLVKSIFQDEENEDHLFALKLALFEVNKIRNSKDNENKKKLRQAKNKIEVLKTALDIVSPPIDTSFLQ